MMVSLFSSALLLSLCQIPALVTGEFTGCETSHPAVEQNGDPDVRGVVKCRPSHASQTQVAGKQPVIIDTDIGSFDDDAIAIALALSQPDLDVRLVITCSDDTRMRARIVAKFLTLFRREDVPVGIGEKTDNHTAHTFWPWTEDYELSQYKGVVYEDGITKMAEIITTSTVPVDIIAIGPMTNFPKLLRAFPDAVKNARVRAMGGSVYRGYRNNTGSVAEYNVRLCPACFNMTLFASWNAPVAIAPLDTSGITMFNITHMKLLLSSLNPLALGVTNDLAYYCLNPIRGDDTCNWAGNYTAMFDVVATLLTLPTLAEKWLVIKQFSIVVTSEGYTEINKGGALVDVAIKWQRPSGLADFIQYLAETLSQYS